MSKETVIHRGVCKWFSGAYGFLTPIEGGADVFVHYSAIISHGYKSLYEGQNVTYQVVEGAKGKGFQAANVEIVD
jgi:cold shock protein